MELFNVTSAHSLARWMKPRKYAKPSFVVEQKLEEDSGYCIPKVCFYQGIMGYWKCFPEKKFCRQNSFIRWCLLIQNKHEHSKFPKNCTLLILLFSGIIQLTMLWVTHSNYLNIGLDIFVSRLQLWYQQQIKFTSCDCSITIPLLSSNC